MVAALLGMGALGAGLHIAGSFLIVFGQASVKVAHSITDSGAPSTWAVPRGHPHPPLWRRPDGKWRRQKAGSKAYAVGGWAAFAAGNLLRFVAMRFAAQTVLSGLGSLQFVIIPVASRFMLGIRASTATAVGVAVVLAGNALIILFGPGEVAFTLPQLRAQWATPAMTTFLLVLGGALCALQWAHWRLLRAAAGLGSQQQLQLAEALEAGKAAGAASAAAAAGGADDDGIPPDRQHLLPAGSGKWVPAPAPRDLLLGPGGAAGGLGGGLGLLGLRDADTAVVFAGALLFSAVASFVGAWSVLFSKSLTYVVTAMPASLADWYSWFVLAAFFATAAFWVRQSDRGLRYYPASLIMPLMQAFWMCMSVLEGGIYFEELAGLPPAHLGALVAGLVLALLGAIGMGVAGYISEKPEHILLYSAAASELAAADAGGGAAAAAARPPATVGVLVEKLHAATGRIDRLSSPVLRPGSGVAQRNGYTLVATAAGSGGGGSGGLSRTGSGKRWWQRGGGSGSDVMEVHATAVPSAASGLSLELPPLGGSATPQGLSPRSLARAEAVRSPTQQRLSRQSSGSLGASLHTAFDRALAATAGTREEPHTVILLDSRGGSPRAGPTHRRP